MSYASGRHALAECQRCGFRVRYVDLVDDGSMPGLRVCTTCFEPHHPQEDPPEVGPDAVALHRPSPELSIPDGEGDAAPDIATLFE